MGDGVSVWRGGAVERRAAAWSGYVERRYGARSAPNLEEGTLDDVPALPDLVEGGAPCRAQWNVKLTQYPDGLRVTCSRQVGDGGCFAPHAGSESERSDASECATDARSRSDSSIRRSKALVVHRMRCLAPESLWTFTKRGKFSSAADAWSAWSAFRRKMIWRFGRDWRYVAVPELHSDGETWHLHVAFNRWCWVGTLRRFWYQALGGSGDEVGDASPGSVNVKVLRRGGANARRVAGYLAAYVGKGFERGGSNKRVFAASCGLHPLRAERWRSPYEYGSAEMAVAVGRWVYQRFGVERVHAWFYTHRLVEGFICSS